MGFRVLWVTGGTSQLSHTCVLLLYFLFGPHPEMLGLLLALHAESLLAVLRDHTGCQGSNLGRGSTFCLSHLWSSCLCLQVMGIVTMLALSG